MSRKQFTTEEIVSRLSEAVLELSRGCTVPQLYRKLGIAEQT